MVSLSARPTRVSRLDGAGPRRGCSAGSRAFCVLAVAWALACGSGAEAPESGPALTVGEPAGFGGPVAIVPDDVPDYFPRYPGAELVELDRESYDEGLVARFSTDGPFDSIQQFYEQELGPRGWQISVQRRLDDRFILFADRGPLEMALEIFRAGPPHRIELSLYPLEDEED
ncbi:MAG: hypothetical protein ACE5FG_04210 [Myxococcota bacterium]